MNILSLSVLILIGIIIWILYNKKYNVKKEHLTYTNNCFNTLKKEMQILKELDCSYDNSVAPDEIISDNYNERDNLVYCIFSTI